MYHWLYVKIVCKIDPVRQIVTLWVGGRLDLLMHRFSCSYFFTAFSLVCFIKAQSGAVRRKMLVLYFVLSGWQVCGGASVSLGFKALHRCHRLLLNMWQLLTHSSSSPPVLHSLPSLPLTAHSRGHWGILFCCDRLPWGFGHQMCGQISVKTTGQSLAIKASMYQLLPKIPKYVLSVVIPYNFINTNMLL